MNILFSWNDSVNSAPSSYDITDFKASIVAAGTALDQLFSNINITLTVDVGLDEVAGTSLNGAIADGGPAAGGFLTYAQVINELTTHTANPANLAQLATLPTAAPAGLSNIWVSAGELKEWGLLDANSREPDGVVGFSSSYAYAPESNRAAPGYNLQGLAEHEITHAVLGRIGGSPMQLVDYTSPGIFAASGVAGYFSLDGGVTNLGAFSSADTSDWADGATDDAFNAYATPDTTLNITPKDLSFLSWLGFEGPSATSSPTPTPTPPTPTPTPTPPTPTPTPTPPATAHNFQVYDGTTGQTTVEAGQPYPGPVAGITSEFIDITTHNLNIAALTPNVYIHTGDGNDGINVSSRGGNNVLDGEGGSNFLVGGSGSDTFLVNDLNAKVSSWTTIEGFHTGDAATVWGLTPKDFQFAWMDNGGAAGHTGLTLYATSAGKPEIAVTIAGASIADISSHRLAVQFGTVNNTNYMEINRLG